MKTIIKKLTVVSLLSTTLSLVFAQETPSYSEGSNNSNEEMSILQQIENDIYNLGAALGFMIGGEHTDTTKVSSDLINPSQTIKDEFTVVQYLFATLSINYNFINQYPFIANSVYDGINGLANRVFANKNPNQSSNKLDSPPSLPSPVAQTLQNILSITPDSYCYLQRGNCQSQDWDTNCKFSYTQSKVFATSWGIFPNINDLVKSQGQAASGACSIDTKLNTLASSNINSLFFPQSQEGENVINNNVYLMNQLDSSLLTTPLLYDNTTSNNNSSQTSELSNGLKADNAEQSAENYIKYVTGSVLPPDPMSKEDLEEITKNISNAPDIATQLKSFRDLSKYVLGLRVYAARVSVGIQNIYEILGSRKKLNPEEDDPSQASSQALNEFKMATYRLYNPKANPNNLNSAGEQDTVPWQQMINESSPARVQKETAILLAEINYQLYLMRKQQEKILLTNSVMLLQSATAPTLNVPDSDEKTD